MKISPLGLPMAVIDVHQALNGDWRAYRNDVDVVRVQDPPAQYWAELKEAGFFPKPQVLAWRAPVCGSEEEYLARLPRKDRYDIRVAYRNAAAADLRIDTAPLTAAVLAEFLELYEKQIAGMLHGWPVAVEQRDQILAERDSYMAVTVRARGELVGACLAQDLTGQDEVRARFSAVTPRQRSDGLARALYWEIIREARRRSRRWVSLGRDANLYGHVAKSGLFSFKSRLGFTAVPSQSVDPGSGSHQADRVVRFAELADPALLLSYTSVPSGPEAPDTALRLEVFTRDPAFDAGSYRGVGLAGVAVHPVAV